MSSKLQKNSPSGSVGYDHLLKLLVIGDSGKTQKELKQLLKQYIPS